MGLNKPQTEAENDTIDGVAEEVQTEQVAEEAAAPVQEREEKPVVETTAVATSAGSAPATTQVGSVDQFKSDMADDGMEGLEIDNFSFPTISLPGEGHFQLVGDEESNLGKIFQINVMSSRARYAVKENDDKDAETFFSYQQDGLVKTDGSDATATIAQWAADSGEDNYKPVIKKYLDVVGQIVSAEEDCEQMEELVDDMVILSIPPTSVSKFSGLAMRLKMKGKQINSEGVVLECAVDKKKKAGSGSFYPWKFGIAK